MSAGGRNANVPLVAERNEAVEITFRERIAARLIAVLLQLWNRTLRFEMDEDVVTRIRAQEQILCVVWHNRLLSAARAYRHLRPRGKVCVLVSASRDGAWLTSILKSLGIATARGSSSRRGAIGIKGLLRAAREGWDLGITPDGPRGPRYSFAEGASVLPEIAPMAVVLGVPQIDTGWRLRSWDRFRLPLPFSRIRVHLSVLTPEEAVALPREERARAWREIMLALDPPDDLEER